MSDATDGITVRHLLQTATADINRWWRNQRLRDERKSAKSSGTPRPDGSFERLGFLPKHVQRCLRESELLERALEGYADGASYKQPADTRRLYDPLKLEEALRTAKAAGR